MKDNRMFIGLRDPKAPIDASYDNVIMARLSNAYHGCKDETKIGDSIDRGLVLLRELNAQGFDVIIREPK